MNKVVEDGSNVEDGCEEAMLESSIMQSMQTPVIAVKNHIYFNGEVNSTSSKTLFSIFHETAMTMINVSFENNVGIPPIILHITSPGGDVSEALAIVSCIKTIQNGSMHTVNGIPIPIEVHTIIEGEASSSASLIACIGNKRSVTKSSVSLIHDLRIYGGYGGDKGTDVHTTAENLDKFKDIFVEIYKAHSKLTKEQIEEIMSNEKYSSAQDLLDYGLVDEIIQEY